MQPNQHPSEETLLRFAAATLGEAQSLVVTVHLAFCSRCRAHVAMYEDVGGALLHELPPTPLASDAFAAILHRIDDEPAPPPIAPIAARSLDGMVLPEALQGYNVGPWRFLAPGLKFSRIETKSSDRTKLLLLRAAPGTYLPEHSHSGEETICVLAGGFTDQTGRYGPGDLAEADETLEHSPRVEADGTCICLVAIDGHLRLRSWIGRALQPVFGL